jgi:sulfate adenylyltransferase
VPLGRLTLENLPVWQKMPRAGRFPFFTSLSGASKSTIANVLMVKLLEVGGRLVTLLDGDIVCKHLSSELGFSNEHRNLNICRIGFVAAEITKNGGIAICASITPSIAFVKTCAPRSSRPEGLC